MATYSIEIDCAPFTPRPDAYIGAVLEGSGLTPDDFNTGPPFFGCQAWALKEGEERAKQFAIYQPVFKQRVTSLYEAGKIRYGSW